jgi:hypothetical protein
MEKAKQFGTIYGKIDVIKKAESKRKLKRVV